MYQFIKSELNKILAKELESLQKIAVMGLANAGKTSLIKTILYEFESLMSLVPTKGVERNEISFLGRELIVWDFGGQERYQHKYFVQPELYFQGIKFLYYVIDVQNEESIRESMSYFLKCCKFSQQFNPEFKIVLFFHKYDPDHKNLSQFIQIENSFLDEVLPKLENYHHTITVFHTSTYHPFSIISAFSQPLLSNHQIYDTLCKTIKNFCIDHKLEFAILLVNNFEIGNYYANPESLKKINQSLIGIYQKIYIEDHTENQPNVDSSGFIVNTTKFSITIGENPFHFFFTVGIDKEKNQEERQKISENTKNFTKNLHKILQNSEIIRIGVLRTDNIVK